MKKNTAAVLAYPTFLFFFIIPQKAVAVSTMKGIFKRLANFSISDKSLIKNQNCLHLK